MKKLAHLTSKYATVCGNACDEMSSRRSAKHKDEIEVDERFAVACQQARTCREVCPYGCGKLLAPRTIDYHRLNGCRGAKEDTFADQSKRRSFTCGVCYEEYITRVAFFAHLSQDHDVHPSMSSLAFPDVNTFDRFRHWLEEKGGAHFRQKSGSKTRATGRGIFMMCNRSGLVYSYSATGDYTKDRTGAFRTGYTCCAFINGTIHPDGHVTVRFCGDHYGHDARMRLPQSVKNIIMHKQMEGISNNVILRYLQHHFMPLAYDNIYAQRVSLVNLDELRSLTPMIKKYQTIGLPIEKEEQWEEEFLEKAGVTRPWAPNIIRAVEWDPIDDLAERSNWPRPYTFIPKIRNANGEWMDLDEGPDQATTAVAHMKSEFDYSYDDDGEDAYESTFDNTKGTMDMSRGRGEGDFVDVEDVEEELIPDDAQTGDHHMRQLIPATEKVSEVKRRRMDEEKKAVRMSAGRERVATDNAPAEHSKSYLVDSIVSELDMAKAVVKENAPFSSHEELQMLLRKVRSFRMAMDPAVPRFEEEEVEGDTGEGTVVVGQRQFSVPQMYHPRLRRKKRKRPLNAESVNEELLARAEEEAYREAEDDENGGDEIIITNTGEGKIHFNSQLWN